MRLRPRVGTVAVSPAVESIPRRFDRSRTPPSQAVIDAVAALENVDPIRLPEQLDTTFSHHVEPEALDRPVHGDSRMVSFTYEAYEIHITEHLLHVSHRI